MSIKQYQLNIRNIHRETEDAITVEFEHPEGEKLNYQPGQFLTLLINIEGEELRRAYSLCTSPLTDEFPAITVKRVEGGKVSNYLNDTLKTGDSIRVLAPMGVFTTQYSAEQTRTLILFAGGSGITPMMAILKNALLVEPNTFILLIYANRDGNSIIFKTLLEKLEAQYAGRFRVVHILEKAPLFWSKGYKGRLNTKILKKILQDMPKKENGVGEYFMCGPNGMMNQIIRSFEELKLPIEKLKKESFGLSPDEAAQKQTQNVAQELNKEKNEEYKVRKIKVIYGGETYEFEVAPDRTILETAQSLDIDLPYSCQSGMCTACMGKAISGKVKLDEEDALTPKELAQGYVLTCVGHPMSDDVVIKIN